MQLLISSFFFLPEFLRNNAMAIAYGALLGTIGYITSRFEIRAYRGGSWMPRFAIRIPVAIAAFFMLLCLTQTSVTHEIRKEISVPLIVLILISWWIGIALIYSEILPLRRCNLAGNDTLGKIVLIVNAAFLLLFYASISDPTPQQTYISVLSSEEQKEFWYGQIFNSTDPKTVLKATVESERYDDDIATPCFAGLGYLKAGKKEKAAPLFQECLDTMNASDEDLYLWSGVIDYCNGDLESAEDNFASAKEPLFSLAVMIRSGDIAGMNALFGSDEIFQRIKSYSTIPHEIFQFRDAVKEVTLSKQLLSEEESAIHKKNVQREIAEIDKKIIQRKQEHASLRNDIDWCSNSDQCSLNHYDNLTSQERGMGEEIEGLRERKSELINSQHDREVKSEELSSSLKASSQKIGELKTKIFPGIELAIASNIQSRYQEPDVPPISKGMILGFLFFLRTVLCFGIVYGTHGVLNKGMPILFRPMHRQSRKKKTLPFPRSIRARKIATRIAREEPEKGLFSSEIKRIEESLFPLDLILAHLAYRKLRRAKDNWEIFQNQREDIREIFEEIAYMIARMRDGYTEKLREAISQLKEKAIEIRDAFSNRQISFTNARDSLNKVRCALIEIQKLIGEDAADNINSNETQDIISYYELFDLPLDFTTEALKKSYRQKANEWHPDRNPGNLDAERRMRLINEAFETLNDPAKRKAYDIKMGFKNSR